MTQTSEKYPVSIFGIIIVGLITGVIVGLFTSPSYTFNGFLLGFAAGSLITAGVSLYVSGGRTRPS